MDKYSYSPNSRISRRIKERERRKRRNRRIIRTVIIILITIAAAIGAYYALGGGMPKLDPAAGVARMTSKIRGGKAEPAVKISPSPAAGNTSEPTSAPTPEPTPKPVQEEEPGERNDTAGIYPAPTENNNLLDIFKNAAGEETKVCCLTFDDGPNSATTGQILDTLAKYGVKATFFEVGDRLAQNRELAERTYAEGHLLANHTYSQKYSNIYKDWQSFWGELEQTQKLIDDICGEPQMKLVRFPGGSFNSGVYGAVKQEYKKQLAEQGFFFVDWNAENGDDGSRSAAQVAEYVRNSYGSKPIILLMEDSSSRKATVQSLAQVIEYLQSRDYVFKRLDEICYYTEENAPKYSIPVVMPEISAHAIFQTRGRF